jgi:hypothetical protein
MSDPFQRKEYHLPQNEFSSNEPERSASSYINRSLGQESIKDDIKTYDSSYIEANRSLLFVINKKFEFNFMIITNY